MSSKIIITNVNIAEKDVLLCGLIENDLLAEVHLERMNVLPDVDFARKHGNLSETGGGLTTDVGIPVLGNIYVGKVHRVLKNINAAFVETAPGVFCYLPLESVKNPVYVKKTPAKKIAAQDELLVQVQKEAVKTKVPTVSTNLNLTGRYVVLTTENTTIGISSRLDKPARAHYRELLKNCVTGEFGIIVRTNAKNAADEEILSEINQLADQMRHMISCAQNRTCFACVHRAVPKYLAFLRNAHPETLDEIVTDLPQIFDEVSGYCGQYRDMEKIPLRLYDDPMFSLANLYNLNKQMMRATQKNIRLKSGGFLVIEPTEALTVIDVNTGKSISGKDPQKHFRQINLEASKEIARQLRLRNISGIIIIDYIDMESKEDQQELLDFLKKQVRPDPVPVRVHDITSLNLVEVTRKKVEKSLLEQVKSLDVSKKLC
ncbi:MAG: ribonuclease E/G [Clostridiales bacterium]|nr:ribonuclease E/G [Clostridiales bacterium]